MHTWPTAVSARSNHRGRARTPNPSTKNQRKETNTPPRRVGDAQKTVLLSIQREPLLVGGGLADKR